MPKIFALTAAIVALTASTAAEAGITAVFGGAKPALVVDAAVCPAPAGALDHLGRFAAADLTIDAEATASSQ